MLFTSRPTLLLENYQPWLDLKVPSKVDASVAEVGEGEKIEKEEAGAPLPPPSSKPLPYLPSVSPPAGV